MALGRESPSNSVIFSINRLEEKKNICEKLGKLPISFCRVESEQRHIEDRQNASQLSTMDKQDDRILAEAKQDKLRYLEEVHSAQRKMNDLNAHLKVLESKLADKDVEIRLLQEKKSILSNIINWLHSIRISYMFSLFSFFLLFFSFFLPLFLLCCSLWVLVRFIQQLWAKSVGI